MLTNDERAKVRQELFMNFPTPSLNEFRHAIKERTRLGRQYCHRAVGLSAKLEQEAPKKDLRKLHSYCEEKAKGIPVKLLWELYLISTGADIDEILTE